MPDQNSKLIKKILLSYAATFILINFADSLTMIADGLVVSRGLGSVALASIGLADPSYKIVSLFSGVFAVGLQSLCAQSMGSGDKEKTNSIFSAGIIVTILSSILLTIFCFTFMDDLCRIFGAGIDPELYFYLYDYLRGWFTGIPGFILFFVLSPLVSLDGNKINVTTATFIQSGINIAGDIIEVFVLHNGTYGVGFSTGLSYNVSACIILLSFLRKRSVFKLFSSKPDFKVLPRTIRIGLPMITQQCCRILAPILINRTIIAVGGNAAMSAISVKSSIFGFSVILGNGVAESVGLMTQILFSEKDSVSLKQTVKIGLNTHILLNSIWAMILFGFSGGISELFFAAGSNEWFLGIRVIRCLALSIIFNGCNLIIIQYLQGARKMVPVHIMTLFQRMISLTVFTFVLGKMFGINGLFAAIPVSEAAVLIGYFVVIFLSKRRDGFWNSVLMIPDGFGYNSENSFSVSISSVEEAVAVSERIEEFCIQHKVDRRKSYFSARCMEELSTNVIERAFSTDGKNHHCDIRVMIDPEEVVLRIRDDCPYYNIRERFDDLAEDDIDAGVWIRLVFALAKDVNYINIFNTNTLIIRM